MCHENMEQWNALFITDWQLNPASDERERIQSDLGLDTTWLISILCEVLHDP